MSFHKVAWVTFALDFCIRAFSYYDLLVLLIGDIAYLCINVETITNPIHVVTGIKKS